MKRGRELTALPQDCPLPSGMVCVVLEDDNSVSFAPTCDPAAAINLEYLMLALQVRKSTGKEAKFSLDPSTNSGMQVKRFTPDWLSGTSAGDVLFQADYYLKELSMGELEQPVVGMRSCFDLAVAEGFDERWRGRAWFTIRKADLQLSEDNVLVPTVKMAVEAREQVEGSDGTFHDAPITRSDHPLVRYADAFTKNFELIAERRGAVYYLRELAKASLLARFMLEACDSMNQSWFSVACESAVQGQQEIPCLWSERSLKQTHKDETPQTTTFSDGPARVGIYGGVQLELGPPAPAQWDQAGGVMAGLIAAPGAAAAVPGAPGAVAAAVPGAGVARAVRSRRSALKMRATRRGPRVLDGPGLPQGVDLNLEDFDLDVGHIAGRAVRASGVEAYPGKAVWANVQGLGGSGSPFKETDTQLLKSIFNPHLTDRGDEGDHFCPPDPSQSHVNKLRSLVKAEDAVRQQRRERFLSTNFSATNPGPPFPDGWTRRYDVVKPADCTGEMQPRPDYRPSRDALRPATLIFDETAEDGSRFRIYRPGSIEVRTIQEFNGEEVIGMVFALNPTSHGLLGKTEEDATLAKVEH